jgi:hypothetical protein
LEEVAIHVGHEDLVEFDDNNLAIVGNPKGIFDQQLRPHPINLLNISFILIYYIKVYIIYVFI